MSQEEQDAVAAVVEDVYNFQLFDQAIQRLKSQEPKDLNAIRDVRLKILKHIRPPLSTFKEWLEDEKSSSDTQRTIFAYKELVRTYPITETWEEFIRYLGEIKHPEINSWFNTFLQEAGFSVINTDKLWNLYFQYQYGLSDDTLAYRQEDYSAIKDAYIRKLSFPHLKIDETWLQYNSFISKFNSSNYDKEVQEIQSARAAYSFSANIAEELTIYEYRLSSNSESYTDWLEYLQHIRKLYHRKENNAKRTTILSIISQVFERAVASLFSTHDDFDLLWVQFIKILLSLKFKASDDIVHNIDEKIEYWLEKFIQVKPNSYLSWATYLRLTFAIDLQKYILMRNHWDYLKFHDRLTYKDWCTIASQILLYEQRQIQNGDTDSFQYLLQDCSVFLEIALDNEDPAITIERLIADIYIKLNDASEARDVCKQLMERLPEKLWVWLFVIEFEKKYGQPSDVSNIYRQAAMQVLQLQWPEPILNDWLLYEQLYGTQKSYDFADRQCFKAMTALWEQQAQIVEEHQEQTSLASANDNGEASATPVGTAAVFNDTEMIDADGDQETKKRGPGDDNQDESADYKKLKAEHAGKAASDKRDREHLSVKVTHLPIDTTEQELIEFFADCGDILSIYISVLDHEKVALVEFSEEVQLLAALTKTYKQFKGNEIQVDRINNNTVFVTNFGPRETADSLKQEFSKIAEVTSIRFPSLKYNADRRFCYVEFSNAEDAEKAVRQLNGVQLRSDFIRPLSVKISNPQQKLARAKNATEEGREVYIRNLDFNKTTSNQVKRLFEKYGKVQKVHLPLSLKSRSLGRNNDGYGFVIFETLEEARNALSLNMMNFQNRIIEVSIAQQQASNKFKKVILNFNNQSQIQSHAEETEIVTASHLAKTPDEIRNSTISILNLPDTINANQLWDYLKSKVGPVNKVDLRSITNSALIEFVKPEDAGKAGLVLNGEILNGSLIKVGTRVDFQAAQHRKSNQNHGNGQTEQYGNNNSDKNHQKSASALQSSSVSLATSKTQNTSTALGGGGGRRLNLMMPTAIKRNKKKLQQKKAKPSDSGPLTNNTNENNQDQKQHQNNNASLDSKGAKSNDDFRKLFFGGK